MHRSYSCPAVVCGTLKNANFADPKITSSKFLPCQKCKTHNSVAKWIQFWSPSIKTISDYSNKHRMVSALHRITQSQHICWHGDLSTKCRFLHLSDELETLPTWKASLMATAVDRCNMKSIHGSWRVKCGCRKWVVRAEDGAKPVQPPQILSATKATLHRRGRSEYLAYLWERTEIRTSLPARGPKREVNPLSEAPYASLTRWTYRAATESYWSHLILMHIRCDSAYMCPMILLRVAAVCRNADCDM